ncbi:MAG TPA: hypothetical protein VHC73_09280 [Vitreimonas sp.]|jgi:hypothetical protein|nr:hypothetical protein [Vitreimonas sp.]
MKKLFTRGFVLALAAAASACASVPMYSPQAGPFASGYSEQRVDEQHWRVEYVGDPRSPRELVERFLLFRSAELTLGSGYDWFETSDHVTDTEIVVNAPPLSQQVLVDQPDDLRPSGEARRARRGQVSFERFVSHQTIEMGAGQAPTDAFDAAAVQELLSPAIHERTQ